jgi:hypothetical protein
MPRYFLAEHDRLFFEQRWQWSFNTEEPPEGHLRLYNKNAMTCFFPKIVEQCQDRYGWVVEADEVPPYFQHILKIFEGSA